MIGDVPGQAGALGAEINVTNRFPAPAAIAQPGLLLDLAARSDTPALTFWTEPLDTLVPELDRKVVGTRAPILIEARANARWSLDFVRDPLPWTTGTSSGPAIGTFSRRR